VDVAILTVGDELLAGDTENTNATWLADRLTGRGATVARILVVPDEPAVLERRLRDWADRFDRVVVTGGLGGTHDDVTVDAVAAAFDRDLVVLPDVERDVAETVATYREERPDLTERYPDLAVETEAWAALPEGCRPLLNPVGLCPGCVVENVVVLPGPPDEMRAVFDRVADEFDGSTVSETFETPAPEGAVAGPVDEARARFDVTVGSYPRRGADHNRLKVIGDDPEEVAAARDWLRDRVETVD
jgi:molybdenum cofactor synthesis domain-containing protein